MSLPLHPTSSSIDQRLFLLLFLFKTCDHAVWKGWWWRWILYLWWHCCLFGSWLLWWRWCSTCFHPAHAADKYGICKEKDIKSRHVASSVCLLFIFSNNTFATLFYFIKPWAVQRGHGYSSNELLVFARYYIDIYEVSTTATNHKALVSGWECTLHAPRIDQHQTGTWRVILTGRNFLMIAPTGLSKDSVVYPTWAHLLW